MDIRSLPWKRPAAFEGAFDNLGGIYYEVRNLSWSGWGNPNTACGSRGLRKDWSRCGFAAGGCPSGSVACGF